MPVTPSQTVGPFFHDGLLREDTRTLAPPGVAGEHIRIEGQVLDGAGAVVPDAMVEIWQANSAGRYRHPADTRELPLDDGFMGWGRAATDDSGTYWFTTVKPGPVADAEGRPQAPHVVVLVMARGLLDHLTTRLYFADDLATDGDAVFTDVAQERRATLLATPTGGTDTDGRRVYRFDIRLQGDGETVFFDVGGRRGGR